MQEDLLKEFNQKTIASLDVFFGKEYMSIHSGLADRITEDAKSSFQQIKRDTAQEAYLECVREECGEGQCAEAIKTKFKLEAK